MTWSEQRTLKHGSDEHVVRRGADGVYHLGPPLKRAVELRSPPKVVKPPPPKVLGGTDGALSGGKRAADGAPEGEPAAKSAS